MPIAGFDEEDNRELALRARIDPGALRELTMRCAELAMRIARRVCRYPDDVEDAAQSMLTDYLPRAVRRYKPSEGSLYSFLCATFAGGARNANQYSGTYIPAGEVEVGDGDSWEANGVDPVDVAAAYMMQRIPSVSCASEALYLVAEDFKQKSRKNVAAIEELCGIHRNAALAVYYIAVATLRMMALGVPLPEERHRHNAPNPLSMLPEIRAVCEHCPEAFEAVFANMYARIPPYKGSVRNLVRKGE